MNKKRNSLLLRIALPFALLLAVTMGVLSLYLSTFLKSSYLEIFQNNLLSETRLVADRMSVLMQSNSTGEINTRAQLYGSLLNVRVTIIAPNGQVLGDSVAQYQEMENHLTRPEVQRALQKQTSTELRYSNTMQTQMLYAAAPILNANGEIIGIARLAVSLQTIQNNETSLLNTVLIATGVAAVLAILLGLVLAMYTIAPLKTLTDTAQRIADGQLEEISTTTRLDEIGQLHQSIQLMAHHLKAQIADLRAERSTLEAVLSYMTDGIIIVDQDGNVQLINPAAVRMFGMENSQTMNRSLVEVVRHFQLIEMWKRCKATGEQQSVMLETAPDRLFVQGVATPLGDALPGMILLVFQDLTRVRKLETVRRDFVSNVSHELRTPLASLKALTETLQEGALEDPPAARRFLQRMETEIDNLTQMVHELLELSRIESNRVPLQRAAVDPCDLVTPAVERMQLQAQRAGLQVFLDCPGGLPYVKADASRIEQVLVNLIHNAIKFTRPGGEIHVSAQQDQSMVVFSIQDNGVGISPDVLPRIFERFYKVDRARSSGGTGLGLSIARHIVEAHGGTIWAESVENQGSTFSFSLPVS